jgi:AbrB family looped-hinge helix DNA binding protein
MTISHSKLTAQGQISVPAEVRRKLGLGPGSIIEWQEAGGEFIVRRAGKVTSQEIHEALFPDGPPPARTLDELKEGIAAAVRRRHARR